jgi:hypothetical protein
VDGGAEGWADRMAGVCDGRRLGKQGEAGSDISTRNACMRQAVPASASTVLVGGMVSTGCRGKRQREHA